MFNPEQRTRLIRGVGDWNKWRSEHRDQIIDLTTANLIQADLSSANLSRANLSGAELQGADLSGANLSGAYLTEAVLSDANLSRANLSSAVLREANLSRANLSETVLTTAKLFATIFGDTDLTNSKGLDSCVHDGPSTIDHRTLTRSGPLPLAFLRGVGLPDLLIDLIPALRGNPIQFYACFISYSHRDEAFAQRLHADLQNKSVRCWFAPEDMKGGRKIYEQVDEAIRVHDKLLLVLSEASIASRWVQDEIRRARRREVREGRRVLFPIRLMDYEALQNWECFDTDTVTDLAAEIRAYFIPDFATWRQDQDAYDRAFERLLRDLRAESTTPPLPPADPST